MSMFTNKRIMVVAAHPDDELLGLGATMHKLIKTQGVQTRVIIWERGLLHAQIPVTRNSGRKSWKGIIRMWRRRGS